MLFVIVIYSFSLIFFCFFVDSVVVSSVMWLTNIWFSHFYFYLMKFPFSAHLFSSGLLCFLPKDLKYGWLVGSSFVHHIWLYVNSWKWCVCTRIVHSIDPPDVVAPLHRNNQKYIFFWKASRVKWEEIIATTKTS